MRNTLQHAATRTDRYDIDDIARAIVCGLEMGPDEQRERMRLMRRTVRARACAHARAATRARARTARTFCARRHRRRGGG